MTSGLAMEGGAMRGMFTAGVLDVFMENGINFDMAAGISAGATFGCNLKSKQIGRAIRYNKRFCRDWRYASFRSLVLTGDLFGKKFCYETLPDQLDEFDTKTYRENPMRFFLGATNVDTGHPVFFESKTGDAHDITWMRASASMPLVSRIVEIDGYRVLDGGITCPVPYRFLEKKGCDRIVILLTQPKGYRKEQPRLMPAICFLLRRYPALAHAMRVRYRRYNHQMEEIDRLEASGQALVIRPSEPLGIGHVSHDPDELERVYQAGRSEGEKRLEDVKAYLGPSLSIKHNIFLIGFMGAGKSTVARAMHDRYSMDVVEMDQIIEERNGMSIPEIFEKHGEEYFRQQETKLLIESQSKTNVVFSCGGGVPMRDENVKEMRKSGKIVLLTAKPETILERVKRSHDRPLLEHNKTVSHISELMEQRRPKYEAAADIVIDTDGKSAQEICEEIVHKCIEK